VDGVFCDEMFYKQGDVGGAYGWAPRAERAIQTDIARSEGDRVMFLVGMSSEGVLPITLPVAAPDTVTAFTFDSWCRFALIPEMLQRGKTYAVLDNAPAHRKATLRLIFFLHGLQVHFLPTYSPWFAPPEKIFLATHMRCNTRVEHVRADFIRRVIGVLDSHSPAACAGCLRTCGWL
jgi:hypothetical protein